MFSLTLHLANKMIYIYIYIVKNAFIWKPLPTHQVVYYCNSLCRGLGLVNGSQHVYLLVGSFILHIRVLEKCFVLIYEQYTINFVMMICQWWDDQLPQIWANLLRLLSLHISSQRSCPFLGTWLKMVLFVHMNLHSEWNWSVRILSFIVLLLLCYYMSYKF